MWLRLRSPEVSTDSQASVLWDGGGLGGGGHMVVVKLNPRKRLQLTFPCSHFQRPSKWRVIFSVLSKTVGNLEEWRTRTTAYMALRLGLEAVAPHDVLEVERPLRHLGHDVHRAHQQLVQMAVTHQV